MHDAPPATEPGSTHGSNHPRQAGYLTADHIDAVLADFRTYLENLLSPPPAPETLPERFDLSAVVAQFTALRHDVNLQTKATRTATEQAAAAVQQLAAAPKPAPPPPASDSTAPLVKGLIEIADALSASQRQIESVRAGVEPLLAKLSAAALPDPPVVTTGFLGKLFGRSAVLTDWAKEAVTADHQRSATAAEATAKLSPMLAGLADGYTMSLRRVEKALEGAGLRAIPTVGRAFDPELMEVVEVVGGENSGTVVEEVRRGYTRNGAVVRFALVKVAR
ncbi:MAG: nucleotide exchange factor GrpE [Fimbriiglobus sp.]|nr:nucleotide exchange factor GrpE [Fimbriiglobus sp.]